MNLWWLLFSALCGRWKRCLQGSTSPRAMAGGQTGADVYRRRFLQASPLLGQVVAGVVAGPALLDVIPYTAAFKFIGKLGGVGPRSLRVCCTT